MERDLYAAVFQERSSLGGGCAKDGEARQTGVRQLPSTVPTGPVCSSSCMVMVRLSGQHARDCATTGFEQVGLCDLSGACRGAGPCSGKDMRDLCCSATRCEQGVRRAACSQPLAV